MTDQPLAIGVCHADRDYILDAVKFDVPKDLWEFLPLGTRLVVVCEAPETTTEGGIHIPDQAQSREAAGYVVTIGAAAFTKDRENFGWAGISREQIIGARVVFGDYAGEALGFAGEKENSFESQYLLLNDTDIWGVTEVPDPPVFYQHFETQPDPRQLDLPMEGMSE